MLSEQKKLLREELVRNVLHFQKHPQMRPFIGDDYDKTRLLILGESHYLPKKEEKKKEKIDNWYNTPAAEWLFGGFDVDKESDWKDEQKQWYCDTYTAVLVRNALLDKKDNMYKRLHEVLQAGQINGGLNACAYMNFFQRPSEISGASIHNNALDNEYAAHTLNEVCQVLKPTKIYFASVKAFKGLGKFVEEHGLDKTEGTDELENVWRIKWWFNDALIGHGNHPKDRNGGLQAASRDYSKPRGQETITGAQSLRCFAQFQL